MGKEAKFVVRLTVGERSSLQELIGRMEDEGTALPPLRRICRGTLLSRIQYVADVDWCGFADARLEPEAGMTADEIRIWTEAGFRHGGNAVTERTEAKP